MPTLKQCLLQHRPVLVRRQTIPCYKAEVCVCVCVSHQRRPTWIEVSQYVCLLVCQELM